MFEIFWCQWYLRGSINFYKAYQQCDVKYAVPKLVLDQTFQASTVTDSSQLFCKALLLTFGCDAVFPYMAYEALRVLASEGKFLVSDSKGAHKVEILDGLE